MSKTSDDSRSGVMVGFGALAVVIVCAAAYYGGMAGSENAAGTVMQAKRYKADSTTGPTPTPPTADTQQARQPTAGGSEGTAAAKLQGFALGAPMVLYSRTGSAHAPSPNPGSSDRSPAANGSVNWVTNTARASTSNQATSQQPANNAIGQHVDNQPSGKQ